MALFSRKKVAPVEEMAAPEPPQLPPPPASKADGLRAAMDHAEYLLGLVEPLRPFGMSVLEAWDQVMCEDIDSMINVPPNSTAKVEGYAVRASDLGDADGNRAETLQLVEAAERLAPGTAVAVVAGDVLPRGATAVLPGTFVEADGTTLKLLDVVEEGEYLRAAGEHLAVGTRLLSEGEVLNDRAIGMLTSAGIDKVLVRPRPRVVVISSGKELAEPGDNLAHGQTTDANSFMIAAAARAAGATVFRVAVHSNDPAELKQAITDQLIRADLLVSTTGGHREDYEAVVSVMSELGLVDSVQVAMTPGRTQTFGLVGEDDEDKVPMVMLPGNPVSAYVSFHAFVWPLIRKLMGASTERRPVRAIAASTLRSSLGHRHLLRGEVFSDTSIRRVERITDPHAMAELSRSNALIILDEDTEMVRAGEQVKCWLLDEE